MTAPIRFVVLIFALWSSNFALAQSDRKELLDSFTINKIDINNKWYIVAKDDVPFVVTCSSQDSASSNPKLLWLQTNEKRAITYNPMPNNYHLISEGTGLEVFTQLCCDPSGKVKTVRLIETKGVFNATEMDIFLEQLLEYRYSEDWLAPCLDCFLHTIHIKKRPQKR
jgi:hypothetical protein